MAINLLPEPTGGAPIGLVDYNAANTLEQAGHGLNEYNNALTEWDTAVEPEIAMGARITHLGARYECQVANEAITGAPADGHVYIKATVAAGVMTVSFVVVDTGYVYSPIYGGWYHADGTQLLPFVLYKYNSTSWKKTKPILANLNETYDLSSCQIYPHAALETIIQDDSADSVPLPAGSTYWNFGSPNMTNSVGVAPTIRHNISNIQAGGTPPFFSNRGCMYVNAGYMAYSYTFGNEMMIGIRIRPNFAYNVGTDVRILATGYFVSPYSDEIHFFYEQSSDSWRLLVVDDVVAGNYYALNSPAYVSNVALQIATTFFIKISKVNNNVDMWVNGTKIVHGVFGTKVLVGTIANINLPASTSFQIGANQPSAGVFTDYTPSLFYIQDMFFALTYGETYLADWDSVSDKPYFIPASWLSGFNQNWQMTKDGDLGVRHFSCEDISVNSTDTGAGQEKPKIIPIGAWNMNTTAGLSITHGIADINKIRSRSVIIFPDAGLGLGNYFLDSFRDLADPSLLGGGTYEVSATTIYLSRRAGSYFDNTNFNDATMNRGYIHITYLV
jgi:hypothetical protein